MTGYPSVLAQLALSSSFSVRFTATTRTLITRIHACNTDSTARNLTLSVNGVRIYSSTTIAANATAENYIESFFTDLIMQPGEEIETSGSTSGAIHLTVSGREGV
jgi:hypothetical protein